MWFLVEGVSGVTGDGEIFPGSATRSGRPRICDLERIFTEAAGVNAVLLFDKADAIFGKRSEVRDAHDRYANIESAYLLQRMESIDGLAILATNLDEALLRRLDLLVDFPMPDATLRRGLWDRCLRRRIPVSGQFFAELRADPDTD